MIALILLACTSSDPAPPAVEQPAVPPIGFSLAYSGNVDGEIEPCG